MEPDSINYDALTEAVRHSFTPLVAARSTLREKLAGEGWIRTFNDRPAATHPVTGSVAAVDGASVRERLYLQDLLAVRAAAANGTVSPAAPVPPPAQWAMLVSRSADSSKVLATAMAAAELSILNQASHTLRILDGGFVTPLLGLREGLQTRGEECWNLVEDLYNGPWQPLHNLETLYRGDESRPVVAVTKADTGRDYLDTFTKTGRLGFDGEGFDRITDRVFAAHLLNPGEYLTPVTSGAKLAPQIAGKNSEHPSSARYQKTVERAARVLVERSTSGTLQTLFFKPYRSSYAVVKMDFLTSSQEETGTAQTYVETLNQDCRMPHALEPYALWKVDALVKQVSEIPDKVRRGVMSRLEVEEKADFGFFLNQKHRT